MKVRSGTRSSTYMAVNAAIWTFFSIMFLLQSNSFFHPSLIFQVTWIIVGLFVGVFLTAFFTHRMLNTLEKKGEVPTTLKTIFIMIGAAVVAIVAILEISFSNLPISVESALACSVFGGAPAFLITRTVLMVYWERQKRAKIFQDKYGLYISLNNPTYPYFEPASFQLHNPIK